MTSLTHKITIRFYSVDFTDFWSRLIHYGVSVTQRGNKYVHCTIEIDTDGYDLTFNGLQYYDISDKGLQRLMRMRAKAIVVLETDKDVSMGLVQSNAEAYVDSGLRLEEHDLLDWLYGNDKDPFFCTDFILLLLGVESPKDCKVKTPTELHDYLVSQETIEGLTGTYKVTKEK